MFVLNPASRRNQEGGNPKAGGCTTYLCGCVSPTVHSFRLLLVINKSVPYKPVCGSTRCRIAQLAYVGIILHQLHIHFRLCDIHRKSQGLNSPGQI